MKKKSGKTAADIDWENRRLCSDESCIGVIGPDNRCKECGLQFGAAPPKEADTEESYDAPGFSDDPDDASESEVDAAYPSDDEWENRVLCSDESCIGVIGPDGRCKECGKSL